MLSTIALWVGYITMGVGLFFILVWGLLALLDRGVRMLGLIYVITAYSMKNHPGWFAIVKAGLFARGKAPPQTRPS